MGDVADIADPRSRDLRDRIEEARTGVRPAPRPDLPAARAADAVLRNIVLGGIIDRIGIRSVSGNWENTRSDVTHAFTLVDDPTRVHAVKTSVASDALALARSGDEVRFEIRQDGTIVNFTNKSIG